MIKRLLVLMCILCFQGVYAQEYNTNDTLKIDLDHDRVTDTVIFDRVKAEISCRLSTQKFKLIKSLELALEEPQAGIRKSGQGFTYAVPSMRSGYHTDFKYNQTVKKIQLVAMDRYEFGPANNDGSGESSLDLLTNQYEGNWSYYDEERSELIKIPLIKRKMVFLVTYLDSFNDEIAYRYMEKCGAIYEEEKSKITTSHVKPDTNVVWANYYPLSDKKFVVSIKQNRLTGKSSIYFLQQTAQATQTIWKETIVINQPNSTVNYEDFNGDGIKDLFVFSTTGARGANEFYYLYLVNVKTKTLNKVRGFEKIVNPQYDKLHQLIVSYGYAGTNHYSIYKISADHTIRQIGESFEDNFDSDADELNNRIEKLLKQK